MTKSKYLLHFSSDSFLPKKDKSFWIKEACNIFEKNPNIVVANPAWSYQFNEAKKEAQGNSTGNFYLGYGFSDQCYLVRTIDFRARIYNFRHPYSERYPKYGGELFEKRVDSYMRMHNKQRITSVKESYIHSNFPHKGLSKIAVQFLLKINVYFFVHEIKRRNRIVRKLESLYRIGKRCIKRLVKGRHGV